MSPAGGVPNRAALSWAAYAGMFVFGIVMALVGALLPALSQRLVFRVADIGTLFLAMNLAMLACSSGIGLAIDRFGMKPPLVIGPLLAGAAMAMIATASRFAGLIPAVVLLGLGGGALNAATNTLVADLHDDPKAKGAALNVLGVFFGIGALFLPFSVGALLGTFGIARLLAASCVLCLAASFFAAGLRYPAPKQKHRLPVADMPRFLRSPLVLVMAGMLLLQSGVEFTMGGYITTYLTRAHRMEIAPASWVLAGYWASIILARLGLSRSLAGVNPATLLVVCAGGASAASAVAASAGGPWTAAAGICASGLMLSGIFPTALGIAGAAYREFSGTVFGILFTTALTGGTLMPWMAGRLAGGEGLASVFWMVAGAFAAIAILAAAVRRLS